MERRNFLKLLCAGSALFGLNAVSAAATTDLKGLQMNQNQNQKILVDKTSKLSLQQSPQGELIELDFLENYLASSQLLQNTLKTANNNVIGVLSNANFVLLSEFLPQNSIIEKSSTDNNLVYFSINIKGDNNNV